MNEYRIPAQLLQAIVSVLNRQPAGEVFGLLTAIKAEVDKQNAAYQETDGDGIPAMGRQE